MVILLLVHMYFATKITGDAAKEIVWRDNAIVAAYSDGVLCYGVQEPRDAVCHRAVPRPTYKEIR